jgi:hypothetical protein
MSQIAELILQLPTLQFCSSKRREKKPNKKKKGKNSFPVGRLAAAVLQRPHFWGCYVLYKANLKFSHYTLCAPYL